MNKPASDVRPSPFVTRAGFDFTAGLAGFLSIMGFICFVAVMASWLGTLKANDRDASDSLFLSAISALRWCAIFGFIRYALRMIGDIEQHTFRAAQCLSRIVESQERKQQPKP